MAAREAERLALRTGTYLVELSDQHSSGWELYGVLSDVYEQRECERPAAVGVGSCRPRACAARGTPRIRPL